MNRDLAIIIPAYKADYLDDTLKSIASQTDKRFTVYIGDDCSPDNLLSIITKYENSIPIVYHRFEQNMGGQDLVNHWHRCVDLSKEEPYIWLFSDDDTMDSNCVEEFHKLPNHIKNSSLIHFNIRKIKSQKGKEDIVTDLPVFAPEMKAGDLVKAKLTGKVVSYVVEFIFSRELYLRENRFENFDLAWGSDFMTWLKFASASDEGIITIPSAKVNWRSSEVNISPNKSYPVTVRKIKALIQNAVFLKTLMRSRRSQFASAPKLCRSIRFPLGEIYRNRKILPATVQIKLIIQYLNAVLFNNMTAR